MEKGVAYTVDTQKFWGLLRAGLQYRPSEADVVKAQSAPCKQPPKDKEYSELLDKPHCEILEGSMIVQIAADRNR